MWVIFINFAKYASCYIIFDWSGNIRFNKEYSYDGTIIGGPYNGIIVRLRKRQKYFMKITAEVLPLTVETPGVKSIVIRVVA